MMMRILAIHNYYQQRGGEDQCFEDEVAVLKAYGHPVEVLTVHNDAVEQRGKINVALQSIWNSKSYEQVQAAIEQFKPGIVHVMNSFPLLSPSVLHAAKSSGVAVVQEVQNYRMFCPGTFLMRDGKHCQTCIGKRFAWPSVVHRCYRGSLAGSFALATSNAMHQYWKTWEKAVDLFICPSSAARELLIQAGLPKDRLWVKPNSLNQDPHAGQGSGGFFVFVGRLSPEKGLRTLLEAWQTDSSLPTLKIVGDGPDRDLVDRASAVDSRIEVLGKMPLDQLLSIVGEARALVIPSTWNETFGRTTVEAFAKGTPVVGSRIGGTEELIDEGRTGWLFEPGSTNDLLFKLRLALETNGEQLTEMRRAARTEFQSKFLPEHNYQALARCYQRAIELSNTASCK